MIFVVSEEGKATLTDVENADLIRSYTCDPVRLSSNYYCGNKNSINNDKVSSLMSFPLSVAYNGDIIYLSQNKKCIFSYISSTVQPVQKSFTTEIITALSVSPCGLYMIGGGGGNNIGNRGNSGGGNTANCLFVWSLCTGELLKLVKTGHMGPVKAICFSHDGSLVATASVDSTCRVWQSEHLCSLCNGPEWVKGIGGVVGSNFYDGDDNGNTGDSEKGFTTEAGTTGATAAAGDSATTSGSSLSLALFGGTNQKVSAKTVITCHTLSVEGCSFFKTSSKNLVTVSLDRSIRVHDALDGTQLYVYHDGFTQFTTLSISLFDNGITAGGRDGGMVHIDLYSAGDIGSGSGFVSLMPSLSLGMTRSRASGDVFGVNGGDEGNNEGNGMFGTNDNNARVYKYRCTNSSRDVFPKSNIKVQKGGLKKNNPQVGNNSDYKENNSIISVASLYNLYYDLPRGNGAMYRSDKIEQIMSNNDYSDTNWHKERFIVTFADGRIVEYELSKSKNDSTTSGDNSNNFSFLTKSGHLNGLENPHNEALTTAAITTCADSEISNQIGFRLIREIYCRKPSSSSTDRVLSAILIPKYPDQVSFKVSNKQKSVIQPFQLGRYPLDATGKDFLINKVWNNSVINCVKDINDIKENKSNCSKKNKSTVLLKTLTPLVPLTLSFFSLNNIIEGDVSNYDNNFIKYQSNDKLLIREDNNNQNDQKELSIKRQRLEETTSRLKELIHLKNTLEQKIKYFEKKQKNKVKTNFNENSINIK